MPVRWSLCEKSAVDLLKRIGVKSAPVPIKDVAKTIGAAIVYEPFEGNLSGMIHRRKDESAVIGVNSLHSTKRQRFTIAHEIGHLLLHKDMNLHVDEKFPMHLRNGVSSLGTDEKEVEANQFAAELLMPTKFLLKDLRKTTVDLEDPTAIEELAERYRVSAQAMAIRLSRLGV